MDPHELMVAWNAQQCAFVEMRELRTRCVVDVLAARQRELGRPIRMLDLGCGSGSLATAFSNRLPG